MAVTELILDKLRSSEFSVGLEFHPFCIGWYNDSVSAKFALPYSESTLAFCVISQPCFFEDVLLPFIAGNHCQTPQDPLDQCISHQLENLTKIFREHEIEIIRDFEVHPSRRPKILVQTAGHVSGAAYYYQKSDVKDHPWEEKKIYGVSAHPRFGGWFAFRGILVFTDINMPLLQQKLPVDDLSSVEKIKLLEGFNYHWKEWWFRDVHSPVEKYSETQMKYFETKPADRFELLRRMKEEGKI